MAGLCACWIIVEHNEAVDWGRCEDVGDLVLRVEGPLGGEFGEGAFSRDAGELLWCHCVIAMGGISLRVRNVFQSPKVAAVYVFRWKSEKVRGSGEIGMKTEYVDCRGYRLTPQRQEVLRCKDDRGNA